MSPHPTPLDRLRDLLQSLSKPSKAPITSDHVHLIEDSLIPDSPKAERSIAYICLTKIVEDASSSPEARDQRLAETFRPILDPFLAEEAADETNERYLPPTMLLAALFPLAPATCSSLLTDPLSQESEAPDALAVLLEMAELYSPFQLAFGEMCVAAAGTKAGRELIKSRALEWLRGGMDLRHDGKLAGVCCAALAKLGGTPGSSQLVDTMLSSLRRSKDSPSTVLAIVEGLSVISTRPATKHYLSIKPDFLQTLMGLLPAPPTRSGSLPPITRSHSTFDPSTYEPIDTSLCYGIVTILVNLSSRKPLLSAEDEQIAKLRAMAEQGKTGEGTELDTLDQNIAVQARVERLYAAGVVTCLSKLVRAESMLVRQMVGKLCLNLVEEKNMRMVFIRDGGYKVLSEVTRKLLVAYVGKPDSSTSTITTSTTGDIDILPALQATAKLIVTTPPNLLFPPPHLITSLNALTPLYTLLTHPSSSLLQTFEALMGLTNLASISPDIADRIVSATITPKRTEEMWRSATLDDTVRIIGKVEELMMEDNELVRRAATELVCNLAGCEKGFRYFSGEIDGSGKKKGAARAKQRLTFLLVLMDVEDLGTRLAAGGALAIITESPTACATLLEPIQSSSSSMNLQGSKGRSAWKRLSTLLEPEEVEEEGEKIALISTTPPNEGMLLRVVCILHNLLQYTMGLEGEKKIQEVKKAKEDGVEIALKGLLGMGVGEAVLAPAVECLKLLKRI